MVIIVQSGNDACITSAENIAGSEESFAMEMNDKAEQLELNNSYFKNATGLPEEGHVMSPMDLAVLARKIISGFPEYYGIYSETEFTYNNVRQYNRNPMLGDVLEADGLKTGHTDVVGYGLVGSVKRGNRRLIMVLNGIAIDKKPGETPRQHKFRGEKMREKEAKKVMEWAFREFNNYKYFKTGDLVTEGKVWFGKKNKVSLVAEKDIFLTLRRGKQKDVEIFAIYDSPIEAPIKKGDEVGKLLLKTKDGEEMEYKLLAGETVLRKGAITRLFESIRQLILRLVSQTEEVVDTTVEQALTDQKKAQ